MDLRIHILGPSGSGTSTLGSNLSQRLGCPHLDTDWYFWKKTPVPFSAKEDPDTRIRNILNDIKGKESWILSGSLCGWGDTFIQYFTHVIYLWIPWNVRRERILNREIEIHGQDAISEGGDMYDIHRNFIAWASRYDTAGLEQRSRLTHEKWIENLPNNINRIALEGEYSEADLVEMVLEKLQ